MIYKNHFKNELCNINLYLYKVHSKYKMYAKYK